MARITASITTVASVLQTTPVGSAQRFEYDFNDDWQHTVRVKARLALQAKLTYPCCVGGKRRAPPEECGGAEAFMARRDDTPLQVEELLDDLRDDLENNDMQAIRNRAEELRELQEWLSLDDFDRLAINRQLQPRNRCAGI